jgi:D-tyrosyl-tRNA(Tyr) deacylase
MKFLIQRVLDASVEIDGRTVGQIGKGYLVLIGCCGSDTTQTADLYLRKLLSLRIFEDENGKTNLSLKDVGGSLLLVSQFTLYADCRKGNRPGFTQAGDPDHARMLYDYIVKQASESVPDVQTGEFGADMKVRLTNDGPFTILLDESILPAKLTSEPSECKMAK